MLGLIGILVIQVSRLTEQRLIAVFEGDSRMHFQHAHAILTRVLK